MTDTSASFWASVAREMEAQATHRRNVARARRKLAKLHPTLALKGRYDRFSVADRLTLGCPRSAPLNATIGDVLNWLERGAPLG